MTRLLTRWFCLWFCIYKYSKMPCFVSVCWRKVDTRINGLISRLVTLLYTVELFFAFLFCSPREKFNLVFVDFGEIVEQYFDKFFLEITLNIDIIRDIGTA